MTMRQLAPTLSYDTDAVPDWYSKPIQALAVIAPEAVITGEFFANNFFSGKFGPTLIPLEIEVLLPSHLDSMHVQADLEQYEPELRWRVRVRNCASIPGQNDITQQINAHADLIALCGYVRLEHGQIVFHFTHSDTQEDLSAGRFVPNPVSNESRDTALWLIARYPSLHAPFLGYSGKEIEETFEEIHQVIQNNEYGGKQRDIHFTACEQPIVEKIREWHTVAKAEISPVPLPVRSALPKGDPWLAPDAEFREWLIDQTLLRYPKTAHDPDLYAMLMVQRGDQKPSHQGWETYMHAIITTLILETDTVSPHDRRAMRVAAVLHDIGKLHNVWTPGCHALVGAKTWQRYMPSWLTEQEIELITFLIRTHDLPGLMDRGIMKSDYKGAVSPADIRSELQMIDRPLHEALKLMSVVYQADVGSVAALRWLLPLTPLLDQIVMIERDTSAPRSMPLGIEALSM